jgi:hypothetical protein
MAEFTRISAVAKKAINFIQSWSEKEKKLVHKAIDESIGTGYTYTDAEIASLASDLNPVLQDLATYNSMTSVGGAVGTLGDAHRSIAFNDETALGPHSAALPQAALALGGYLQIARGWSYTVYGGFQVHNNSASSVTISLSNAGDTIIRDGVDQGTGNSITLASGVGATFIAEAGADVWNATTYDVGGSSDVVDDTTPQLGGNLDVNGNSIVSVAGGNIAITPDTTGDIILDGLKWPQSDGTNTYVLQTDGAAQLSWVAQSGGMSDVVDDTTPQLGGALDVNGNAIVSASAGDIALTPDTTGDVVLDGLKWPQADGTSGQVLQTNGAAQLAWTTVAAGSSPSTGYGEITVEGNATTTTFSGSSSDFTNKVQVVIFDTNGISSVGVTPDHTNDHLTIVNAGPYLVHTDVTITGGNSNTISFALFKNNGATQLGERATVKLNSASDEIALSLTHIVDLAANDTVELWVQNENHTTAITVEDADLLVAGLTGLGAIVEDTTPQLGGDLDVNGNSIVSAAGGDIAITPDTTGDVILDGLKWPQADGTANYTLTTDGAGQLSWAPGSSTWLGLSDTPGSFTASRWVKVNAGGTALEFVTSPVTSVSASGALNKTGTTSVSLTIDAAASGVTGTMSGSDFDKLAAIEAGADVTDAANVAAAGAFMDDVTVSTSAPSGGSAGDVWLRVV